MAHHANVQIQHDGLNGNIWALTARGVEAARKAEIPKAEIAAFLAEMRAQRSYEDALACCVRWFSVG